MFYIFPRLQLDSRVGSVVSFHAAGIPGVTVQHCFEGDIVSKERIGNRCYRTSSQKISTKTKNKRNDLTKKMELTKTTHNEEIQIILPTAFEVDSSKDNVNIKAFRH